MSTYYHPLAVRRGRLECDCGMGQSLSQIIASSLARLLAFFRALWLAHWRGTRPRMYYPSTPTPLKIRRGICVNQRTGSVLDMTTLHEYSIRSLLNPAGPRSECMNIRTFLETRVPSLFQRYKPTWWLPNGHFQTIFMSIADFTKVDKIVYERYRGLIVVCLGRGTLLMNLCST